MYITRKSIRTKLRALLNRKNLIFFVIGIMVVFAAFTLLNIRRFSLAELKYELENFGIFSYIVFFILCSFRSLLILPCGLFSTLGGLLFGPVKGSLITLAGFTAGSLINFYLARLLGKEWADRFTRGKIRKVDQVISRNGFLSILLMRLIPIFPFDVVSCVGGLSRIKAGSFVLGTLVGSVPGVFIYTFLGDSVKTLSIKKIAAAVVIIVLVTAVPLAYKLIFKKKLFEGS